MSSNGRKFAVPAVLLAGVIYSLLTTAAIEAASISVLQDAFDRTGNLDQSAPTSSITSDVWVDEDSDFSTDGSRAMLDTPGNSARASYPVKLAANTVHTFEIDVDVADDAGDGFAATGFAWTILSDSTQTGIGPWIKLLSEDSDVDIETFVLAGAGRQEFNFGEGPLEGVDFTNAGKVQIVIDGTGVDETVQFSFNGNPLGDPQVLFPVVRGNVDGVFMSGTAQATFESLGLAAEPVPEPTTLLLAGIAVIGLAACRNRARHVRSK